MTLPAPNLDDRTFQDLVDDAKRYVQTRCPQWSDHNVSDPGVTLIETFAMVTDQLLYRLNQVPDRLYVRFLELLGLTFVRPTSATTEVTFWLSAPQPEVVPVPAGSEVSTRRTATDEAVRFETTEDLAVVPCSLVALQSQAAEAREPEDHTGDWRSERAVQVFSATPVPGDAVLFGLSAAVPRCAVILRMACEARGAGVDPDDPPWIWEAWNGGYWEPCELEAGGDTTGGFNQPGDVLLHVPPSHRTGTFAGVRAGWLRCRFQPLHDEQSLYDESPLLNAVEAFTVGGTIGAAHQESVRHDMLGVSAGIPGQRFPLSRGPVLPGDVVVEVGGNEGWRAWTEVRDFDDSGPSDEHFSMDAVSRDVVFGPAVRRLDGTVVRLGAVPPAGAPVRASYRVSGGTRGNVLRGAIRTLRSQVPMITGVENRRPASGGVDGEDVAGARERAPAFLRTRDRAVTRADYEYLARDADPRVARVRAISGRDDEPAVIRVVLVPAWTGDPEEPPVAGDYVPRNELLARVAHALDDRRLLGTRLIVSPPHYQWLSAEIVLRVAEADSGRCGATARAALYRYLHPLVGGPQGRGWPFGRSITSAELLGVLQRRLGVEVPEAVHLYRNDRHTGARAAGGWTNKIELGPGTLAFSAEHTVVLA